MRSVAVAAVLVGAGLVAGHALADTVPVPVPTVPVPVPTLPVPVPKVTMPSPPVAVPVPASPKAPAPALPAPAAGSGSSTPSAPTVASSVDLAAATVGSILGSSSSVPSSAGSSSSSNRSRPEPLWMESIHSSRSWISTSGPKRRRGTTFTFVLPRDTRVILVVKQVSPTCRIAGQLSVQGHAGLNRVRFPGRGKHLQLVAGTYRISVRSRPGRLLRRVTIVVVDGGAPSSSELSSARAANVCTSVSSLASATAGSTGASNESLSVGHPSASGGPARGTSTHSGPVLGTTVARAARAIQPLFVALLAIAILLLGLASLPRMALTESRTSDLLVRHRIEIAGLGAAAFAAVVIGFLLG